MVLKINSTDDQDSNIKINSFYNHIYGEYIIELKI